MLYIAIMAITLEQAQAQLNAWLAASLAVAQSQSYAIGGRMLRRADANLIQQQINYWRAEVARLEGSGRGGIRVRKVTPL